MTNQPKILCVTVCGILTLCISRMIAAPIVDPDAPAQAEHLKHTSEGKTYGPVAATAIGPRFVRTLNEGAFRLKLPDPQKIDVTFVVSADGRISYTIVPPNQPLSAYVAQHLVDFKFPKPPHDPYPFRLQMHTVARK